MKICFVTTSFIRDENDYYSYFVFEQAHAAVRAGNEVVVVTPHDPGYALNLDIKGVKIRCFPYFYPLKFQKIAYQTDGMVQTVKRSKLAMLTFPFFLAMMCLYVIWHSRKAAAIHAQWIPTAFISLPAKWLWGVPIVVTARGSDLHSLRAGSESAKKRMRFMLNRLDMIFTVSRDFEKALKEEIKVSIPVRPLFNGVDDQFFRKFASSQKNPRRILFLGNILRTKGIATLLEAFKRMSSNFSGVELVLAGEGPHLDEFLKMTKDLALEDRVRFIGKVERADVPALMNSAEMLVLPSLGEGRPNVVLEAFSCELPVIATHAGGTKELVQHEKTGLLFDPGDAVTLEKLMQKFLTDPDYATLLSKNAKQFLNDEGLTWKSHGEKLTGYYKELCAE